jgi:glycosyltransferase involved in cell wall biosynthesis
MLPTAPARLPAGDDPVTNGVRVVIDLRPLQQPDRAPVTAAYLGNLLRAFDALPLAGEEFVALLTAGQPDPTAKLDRLPVIGRRWLPPTRMLRAGALTLDPFLLRGASIAAGGRGASRAVYHVAGAALPLAAGLPVVATVLDLAPWELPNTYQATPAARFGERLRARMLRDATLIVGTDAVAQSVARMLHTPRERVNVVPLAAGPAATNAGDQFRFTAGGATPEGAPGGTQGSAALAAERELLGLPARYIVFLGRYDARTDLPTLLDALATLKTGPRPAALPADASWPPALLMAGTGPDERTALMRAAANRGLDEQLYYSQRLSEGRLATLIAGARAAVRPSISDASGSLAIDAVACGTPVVASAVGALPEAVGSAGVLVEPRDAVRMARAIEAVWSDDSLWRQLRQAASDTAREAPSWTDVATMTRSVYAHAAGARANAGSASHATGDGAAR